MRKFFILFFFHFTFQLFSQISAPKYSNEFLSLGVGAASLGLGNSVVASTNDVNSIYWNPAGLINVNKWLEVSFMHSEYFAGIAKYDYLGLAHSINSKSKIGFAVIRFGVDDIPNTTQLIDNNGVINYNNVTNFSAGDYAFLFSYAQKLKFPGLSLGATAKIIYRNIGDFAKSWGFGVDAGLQYQAPKNWRFGLMARDVTTTFNAWVFDINQQTADVFLSTGNELPKDGIELTLPRFIFASACKYDVGKKGINIGGEIDIDMTGDGRRNTLIQSNTISLDPHFGVFVGYKTFFTVRGGLSNIQEFKSMDTTTFWGVQPNIGLGVGFKGFNLDYAFTRLGVAEANYYTHVFSLSIKLSKPKK